MHKNEIRHNQKLADSVTWLARWGISDAQTLTQAATYLRGEGVPIYQSSSWSSLLVNLGFAQVVKPNKKIRGVNKLFAATKSARLFARQILDDARNRSAFQSVGETVDLSTASQSQWEHKIFIQRAAMMIISSRRVNNFKLVSYTVDGSEMKSRSEFEWMPRQPDCILIFDSEENDSNFSIAIEIERSSRSEKRLEQMRAGLSELVNSKISVNHIDSGLIVCMTTRITQRYKEKFSGGAIYINHKKYAGFDGKYEPSGGTSKIPAVFTVMSISDLEKISKKWIEHFKEVRADRRDAP